MSAQLCASFSTAMIRSLRSLSLSLSFLSPCSPSITPMGRQDSTHPANAGSSIRTKTSIGSPPPGFVEGTNPKSYGNAIPAGKTFLSSKMCSSGSNANLLRLPFGVSITTRSNCLSPEPKGLRRVGSASPFFLLILANRDALWRGKVYSLRRTLRPAVEVGYPARRCDFSRRRRVSNVMTKAGWASTVPPPSRSHRKRGNIGSSPRGPGEMRGWRAADSGTQTIRLICDEPQRLTRISLVFEETGAERTPEFRLRGSPDGGRSFVRQQWNFSPA